VNREEFNEIFKSISNFFGLLSNPDRVKILGLLIKQELDVHDIQEKLHISQSRVSQHLKLLKLNSLVEERREGKHVYYHVKDPNVSKVIESAIQFQMLSIADPQITAVLNEMFAMWHV
jgi:DNA-binding transcriptional ArsR family regulator